MRWSLGWVLAVVLFAGLAVCAQDSSPAVTTAESTGVVRAARLTYVSGGVTLQRADNTGEETPMVNTPLYAGTRIVTADYGEAEVEFEDGSVARMTPRSALSLDVLGLDGSRTSTEMTLLSGLAYFELRKTALSAYRVTAGGAVAAPGENSTVRVSLDDGPGVFSVLTGSDRVERDKAFSTVVKAGESLRLDAKDESRYFLSEGVTEQSWDRWNEERDAMAADEADRRTAARDGFAGAQGYGWSDLDANGSWYEIPGQGAVWQPDAADEGFDPYGYGDWVYGNAGYVFVSGYSWGWTPFRCGRWSWYTGFGWVWAPGSECGSYGFGAGSWGGVRVGHGPPHYRPVGKPLPGPGGVHPIVKVTGPDGPRPPVHTGGPGKVAGVFVKPLPPIGGGGPRSGSMVGQALNRDFPVDRKTGVPVLGVGGVVRPVAAETVGGAVWKPMEGKGSAAGRAPGVAGEPARGAEVHRASPGSGGTVVEGSSAPAPVRGTPGVNQSGTVRTPGTAAPVRSAPVSSSPAPVRAAPVQSVPVRVAPAPSAPAPVRSAPSPAPASQSAAPAANKPK